jgi:hypothetical protein
MATALNVERTGRARTLFHNKRPVEKSWRVFKDIWPLIRLANLASLAHSVKASNKAGRMDELALAENGGPSFQNASPLLHKQAPRAFRAQTSPFEEVPILNAQASVRRTVVA